MRLAREEDIEAIRALEIEAFGFTWDKETFLRELRRADCLFAVAEEEGKTIGMASLNWILDECHLVSIAVTPPWQGRGVARRLLGQSIGFCQAMALAWMTLEVKWDNAPALALYKRYGFTTVGKRKKYYRDGQDARIMWSGRLLEDERYGEPLAEHREDAAHLLRDWKESRP